MRYFELPVAEYTDEAIAWLLESFGWLFDLMSHILGSTIRIFEGVALGTPPEIVTIGIVGLAWLTAGKGVAAFSLVGLLVIGAFGAWQEAMRTLVIVLTATLLSIGLGIPTGILASQSRRVDQLVHPMLDFMQTMPSFVYLIPALMFFGIGAVPAVMATVVFAVPPSVRLTNLGIRQVPADVVEAARAFGSTPLQILARVQFPIALPTIMAGVNQTILLSLSMAVISAMIGAGGLGAMVLHATATVQPGIGLEGGLGIVILALVLDRITQSFGRAEGTVERET